mgnify:CR=1 FL=1
MPTGGGRQLSAAGWWFVYVSLPLFQFILFRWYFRLFVWMRFLWQVTRCDLSLVPTHPDRAGGLGFLLRHRGRVRARAAGPRGDAGRADRRSDLLSRARRCRTSRYSWPWSSRSCCSSCWGRSCSSCRTSASARRVGLREYGTLAQRYVREFDDKWLRGGAPAGEPLVGSADIQSLADLGNSFELVRSMRPVPFTRDVVIQLAVITLLPVVPLLLTMVSLEELLKGLLKVVL